MYDCACVFVVFSVVLHQKYKERVLTPKFISLSEATGRDGWNCRETFLIVSSLFYLKNYQTPCLHKSTVLWKSSFYLD